MSLFSSPAFRVFNSENAESMVQRKQGSNVLSTRKPFVDRTVNCNTPAKTPDVTKKQKQNVLTRDKAKCSSPCTETENLEIDPENYFSYKDVEDEFEDLLPYSKRLEEQHVFSILKSYLTDNTPPPSPTFTDMSFKATEIIEEEYDSSFTPNNSYDDGIFFKLPESDKYRFEDIYEVDVPVIDIENL